MSHTDQCPSSKKEGKPAPSEVARSAREVSRATGRAYWRSLDDLAGTRRFQEFVHREFPANASELLDGSRRGFLKLMGASIALAGAATIPGCRQPDHKILAYNQDPEHIVPGKPLFYATAMPLPGGGCEGLLAETFEGRPTKLEGNPLHPYNRGRSSVWSQASVLSLYDPDRDLEQVSAWATRRGKGELANAPKWNDFVKAGIACGPKTAFLVEKATSPSRDDLRDRILKKFPGAKWYAYEPMDDENALAGSRLAFGGAYKPRYDLSAANVIVSLDCDFLHGEAELPVSRGYGESRLRGGKSAGKAAAESAMSRLYVVESAMTLTGGAADHRWTMKASKIGGLALALAAEVMKGVGGAGAPMAAGVEAARAACSGGEGFPGEHLKAMVEDLLDAKNRGASVVMAGASQPAAVHALAHAINAVLGNVGKTVRYCEMKGDAGQSSAASISAVAQGLDKGEIDTLVIIGGNPVFTAPADLGFAAKLAKAGASVYVGEADETAAAVKTFSPRSHYLESWGDAATWEGQYSVIQPMIKPLWDFHSDLEVLAVALNDGVTDGYQVVRRAFEARNGGVLNEKLWRRTLHDGVQSTEPVYGAPTLNAGAIGAGLAELAQGVKAGAPGVEVVFAPSPHVHDGRWANNGWLQELPHPVSKVSWDNPALISKAMADRLGVSTDRHLDDEKYNKAQVITITVGGQSLKVAAWVQPGVADDTVILHAGYGRERCGRIGDGTGFNVYALRQSSGWRVATGAKVEKDASADLYLIANTQDHWTMEGRDLLREVDHDAWKLHGDKDYSKDHRQTDPYDNSRDLNFAGMLAGATEGHAPANVNIYRKGDTQPLRGQEHYWVKVNPDTGEVVKDAKGRLQGPENKYGKRLQQWGMSIDLTTCTGCSACMIACQAENNIPIVGKIETAKGREMHWIRVDRYYAGDPEGKDAFAHADAPDMLVQPVACVHCENAPCEVVCPVNATTHDPAGLNNMAYNRCIGTKYCSNNCPYKVRRFNWFDYGTKQFKGGYGQLGTPLAGKAPTLENENWVPPRLRAKNLESQNLQKNPHVTVRSRGVMEKCSYCIQRINAASVETKIADLKYIPDGFVQTACQQACPTGAIVFGDIYDYESNNGEGSRASRLRNDPRGYGLLAYLNTRPRTTHLVRVRNPNPKIRTPNTDPFGHHAGGGHGGGAGGGHGEEKPAGHVMSLPILETSPRPLSGGAVRAGVFA